MNTKYENTINNSITIIKRVLSWLLSPYKNMNWRKIISRWITIIIVVEILTIIGFYI